MQSAQISQKQDERNIYVIYIYIHMLYTYIYIYIYIYVFLYMYTHFKISSRDEISRTDTCMMMYVFKYVNVLK